MSRDTTRVLPTRWKAFLEDVDRLLGSAVELHCLGGFVLSTLYDLPQDRVIARDCMNSMANCNNRPQPTCRYLGNKSPSCYTKD
jgi:hypothetical protein